MQNRPRRGAVCALAVLLSACATAPSSGSATGVPTTDNSTGGEVTSPTEAASAQPTAPRVLLGDRAVADVPIIGADFPMAAFGSVWVVAADRPEPAVVRVDPETDKIEAEILVPGRRCQGMTAGFGSVWAFTSANGVEPANALLKINPRTEKAVTIPLGHDAGTMTAAYGFVWVTSVGDGLLLRVDPVTGDVTTVMVDLPKPFVVTAGLDRLWISLHGDPDVAPEASAITVIGVDPESFHVVDEIAAGPLQTFGDIVADDTGLWIRQPAPFLTRFDPSTHDILETVEATKGGGALLAAFGSLWATSYDFGHLWRLEPSR